MRLGDHTIKSVYYVEAQKTKCNPIAIRPHIINEYIAWEDTCREKKCEIKELKLDGKVVWKDKQGEDLNETDSTESIKITTDPKIIEITTHDDKKYTLTKLTIDIFNKLKNEKKVTGDKTFDNDTSLQKYYLETDFTSY